MRKKKLLWISPYAPYDGVLHAGGKVHNYDVKYFHKSGCFDITLLSLCMKDEEDKLDLKKYGIRHSIAVLDQDRRAKMFRLALSGAAYHNPWDSCGGCCLPYERNRMLQQLEAYKQEGNQPEIVILQWTFSLMLLDEIKKSFPNSKVVAIEEDVTYLNYKRKADGLHGEKVFFWKNRYQIMKKKELAFLARCDLIVTNNSKDTALLVKDGILSKRIFTTVPYIEDYSQVKRNQNVDAGTLDVIFWGSMSRPENYQSAIWFIKKVLPKLDNRVRFVVIGNAPDASLRRYESARVLITGYVEDVEPWFAGCLCMAAPLVGGAGIKIKVLEAMSAGVPVLTNEIGIEGIPARNQKEYLYCEQPEDYIVCINRMAAGKFRTEELSVNARYFIQRKYDLPGTLDCLIDRIQEVSDRA